MRRLPVVTVVVVVLVAVGAGVASGVHVFRDVGDSSTHATAIRWAHENGIVEGFADGTFRPREAVLRDQLASMLHRYDSRVEDLIAEAVTQANPGTLAPLPPFEQSSVILDPGGVHVPMPVYVADSDELRQRGLMHVESLPREAGMVFLWSGYRVGGFYMRDTLIPLSIAFFDADGVVRAVLDMEPCTEDPCEIYDPGIAYRGALEVNAGRFDDLGLGEPGWRVEVPEQLWPS